MNPNLVFKVTPFLDAEYLTNGYVLSVQFMHDLFAIAKFLSFLETKLAMTPVFVCPPVTRW